MGLQAESWIMNILRVIFAGIDYMVYSIVKYVLFGIFDLSALTTSSGLMNGIYTRIYVILGIFMAFKLSFSFFQYIVDPDSMSGKSEKGVSKLVSRTIIMLLALVSIPTILFNSGEGGGLIQEAQSAFLPMLPRILLGISEDSGVSVSNGSNTDDISAAADTMAVATLQAFFSPSEELDSACGAGTIENTPQITSLKNFIENVNLSCDGKDDNKGAKYYKYSYTLIVSTVVGALLVLMLLGITIDVAKRVFKMIILEAIAPIPIMSLIDPKSSKDGAFSHWLKSLISTFLDIFLKLGLLYVVIMMVQLIVSRGLFSNWPEFAGEPLRTSYLVVALIIGLIYFAKEAPKFIKDSIGVKDSGAGIGTGMGMAVGALGGLVGGHSLSTMASGAFAGAIADPKVGAWATGRDLGGQIRTGDSNWKGGIPNRWKVTSEDFARESRLAKWGATANDEQFAKDYMYSTAAEAEEAKDRYERYKSNQDLEQEELANIHNAGGPAAAYINATNVGGRITYSISNDRKEDMRAYLYNDSSSKETAATKAKTKYDKIGTARETLSTNKDLNYKYNPGYKARANKNFEENQRDSLRLRDGKTGYLEQHDATGAPLPNKRHTAGSDRLGDGNPKV